jgi:hypothetical protein
MPMGGYNVFVDGHKVYSIFLSQDADLKRLAVVWAKENGVSPAGVVIKRMPA